MAAHGTCHALLRKTLLGFRDGDGGGVSHEQTEFSTLGRKVKHKTPFFDPAF